MFRCHILVLINCGPCRHLRCNGVPRNRSCERGAMWTTSFPRVQWLLHVRSTCFDNCLSFSEICSFINTANPQIFSNVMFTFRLHYKECLVELINNNALDPVVLLDGTELRAEMNRWKVPVPDKQPLEPDQRYEDRLRQVSAF